MTSKTNELTRRDLLQAAGYVLVGTAAAEAQTREPGQGADDWIQTPAPSSPRPIIRPSISLDYVPSKAVTNREGYQRRFHPLPRGLVLRLLPHQVRLHPCTPNSRATPCAKPSN
jgi:hypothetical protein